MHSNPSVVPKVIALLALGTVSALARDAAPAGPVKETLTWRHDEKIDHDYLVFLPEDYDAATKKKWPMIVWLHGGGGTERSVTKRLQPLRKQPFIFLAPVCPPPPSGVEGKYHNWNPNIVGAIIRKVIADHVIDKSRVSLMGFSMGGSAAWETPFWHPDLFNKVAVISGSCHPWKLKHYPKIPVRVFSGDSEPFFLAHTHSVEAAKHFGVDVTHTIWPGTSHGGCCNKTLRDESLWRWLKEGDAPSSP